MKNVLVTFVIVGKNTHILQGNKCAKILMFAYNVVFWKRIIGGNSMFYLLFISYKHVYNYMFFLYININFYINILLVKNLKQKKYFHSKVLE